MEVLSLLLALPLFAGLFDGGDAAEENTDQSDTDLDANGSEFNQFNDASSSLDMLNPQTSDAEGNGSSEESTQSSQLSSSTDGDENDNFIRTERGDDLVDGLGGDDTIATGRGDDFVQGGQGQDEIAGQSGDDILHGDGGNIVTHGGGGTVDTTPVTTSNSTNIPSTGQELIVSLTAADGSDSDSLRISGNVTSSDVSQSGVNIAIVVDTSGSTSSGYVGDPVGDQNGDNRDDTVLDAEIAGVERLVEEIRNAGFPNANVAIIDFDSSANTVFQGNLSEDQDGNGTSDALDSIQTLQSGGGTNFDNALGQAETFLSSQSAGSNFVFFLSDGNASVQDTSVAPLIDPNGIDAEIRAFAVGENANIDSLDILDDLQDNDSAIRVNDPGDLGVSLSGSSGVTATDIDRVEILVDGSVVETLDPATLTTTPFGLSYDFEITGLDPDAAETVEVRVVASDADATTISTSQVVEAPGQTTTFAAANDTIYGGNGDDILFGHGGDDAMYGQRGDDIMNGGEGSDTLIGGDHDDVLDGGEDADIINAGRGDDVLILDDGDIATGGSGADTFEISSAEQNPVSLTFNDYNPSQDIVLIDTNGVHSGAVPTITERSDGSGVEVSVNGAVLASITGVTGITASDIIVR